MIIWLTGQSGAGKTTIAKPLCEDLDAVLLDGDEMRQSISLGAGFSKAERAEHNLRVARLARELGRRQNVVVSVIAPMVTIRREISRICKPIWIYVKKTLPERDGHFYEESDKYFTVDHDTLTPQESVRSIIKFLDEEKKTCSMLIGRYQPLHEGHIKLIRKVMKDDNVERVLIALRDTELDGSNPYTVSERIAMFRKEFGYEIDVIKIPDIKEVCYGRKVGWGIREVRLDKDTEQISATKIREKELVCK